MGREDGTMTAMEGFQPVGENGTYPLDSMQEGFDKTLEHMTWKDSFSMSQEIVEDAKLMDLRKRPAQFIRRVLPHPGEVRRGPVRRGHHGQDFCKLPRPHL